MSNIDAEAGPNEPMVWPTQTLCTWTGEGRHKGGYCVECHCCKKCPQPLECMTAHTGVLNGGRIGGHGPAVASSATPNMSSGTARAPNRPKYADEPLLKDEYAEPDSSVADLAALMSACGMPGERSRPFIPEDLQTQTIEVKVPKRMPGQTEAFDISIGPVNHPGPACALDCCAHPYCNGD